MVAATHRATGRSDTHMCLGAASGASAAGATGRGANRRASITLDPLSASLPASLRIAKLLTLQADRFGVADVS